MIKEGAAWTEREVLKGIIAVFFLIPLLTLGAVLPFIFSQALSRPLGAILATSGTQLGMLGVVWWFVARPSPRRWHALGLGSLSPRQQLLTLGVVALGFLFSLLYAIGVSQAGWDFMRPSSPLPVENRFALLLGAFLALGMAPFIEEAFFRGFVLRGLLRRYGWGRAVVASSLLFSLAHFQLASIVPAFLLGVLLSWLYLRTGTLWSPILAHFFYNSLAVAALF